MPNFLLKGVFPVKIFYREEEGWGDSQRGGLGWGPGFFTVKIRGREVLTVKRFLQRRGRVVDGTAVYLYIGRGRFGGIA